MRFLDPLHLPSSPKSFRYSHNGADFRIPWQNNEPWSTFYSRVKTFQERNHHPVSSTEEVESFICTQLPRGWCTGDNAYRPAAPRPSGCSSCGRRR